MFSPPLPPSSASPQPFPGLHNGATTANMKRKRRPAGTPDPDAEVVALSPRTLLESDQYVCEICGQGFQRDQNLQMHRRRHKVPWRLLKREPAAAAETRKRVYVCPEPTCLHHDPAHALGDLVGIKKHFRRKHSAHRQWACARCSKAYAVQSDYKAHLKTCGTRGHSCDCGRVFSRVESFIEHQDACHASRAQAELRRAPPPVCLLRTAACPSPSTAGARSRDAAWLGLPTQKPIADFLHADRVSSLPDRHCVQSRELQLLPTSTATATTSPSSAFSPMIIDDAHMTTLQLSVGPGAPSMVKEEAEEQLRLATVDKSLGIEARGQARRQVVVAELEFANARRIRQQAQAELSRALVLRDQAVHEISSALMLEITCHACKKKFQAKPVSPPSDENSPTAASHMSSVVTEGEGEGENDNQQQ